MFVLSKFTQYCNTTVFALAGDVANLKFQPAYEAKPLQRCERLQYPRVAQRQVSAAHSDNPQSGAERRFRL